MISSRQIEGSSDTRCSNVSSTSLSSSFFSSAAVSSMRPPAPLMRAPTPVNNQPIPLDHSASSSPPAARKRFTQITARPRPPSSAVALTMGQNYSRATAHNTSTTAPATSQLLSKGIALSNVAATTGAKLKRAFAARRRKSEDSSAVPYGSKGKEREQGGGAASSPLQASAVPQASESSSIVTPDTISSRKPTESSSPPLPPFPISPGMSPAMEFIRAGEDHREQERTTVKQPRTVESELSGSKDTWRKSDSTMSHHTIKPGITGSRTSRPVSMAESFQSSHTIVPVGKRLSALVIDADFGTPEEDDTVVWQHSDIELAATVATGRDNTPPSVRSKDRRSMSLNLGPTTFAPSHSAFPLAASTSATELKYPIRSLDGAPISPSSARETPTLNRAAANGIISPSSAGAQSAGSTLKGRLVAWTAASHGTSSPRSAFRLDRSLPSLPPDHFPAISSGREHPPSIRQAAVSISSSFGPAAGLAKRAVEKMGRAWGGLSSGSSNSGYSSSSSGTAPSSYSGDSGLKRTGSKESGPAFMSGSPGKNKSRKTPNAPSGSWSVTSSATSSSASDSDAFLTPAGPNLGKRLRYPMRVTAGGAGVAGGIVFGRDLRTCVQDTLVELKDLRSQETGDKVVSSKADLKVLEHRMLPAIVVRCAQHLIIWGMQEEGLFRLTGRHSHVAKLRTEFDTGADFDMSECTPGDLDPHAVASIFKAYLRELPEPILTRTLLPYFEAAMAAEGKTIEESTPSPPRGAAKGPSLPSGPRNGLLTLRKPPSLSTLAMPSFSGMRPPSQSLLNALTSLIAQLPQENRDLIRTITELIKITAKNSKETKMPLSNLLVIFCPSLAMNPPLLRILCEGAGIWNDTVKVSTSPSVLDTSLVAPPPDNSISGIDTTTPAPVEATDFNRLVNATNVYTVENRPSGEQSSTIESQPVGLLRSRPIGTPRQPVATIYMDVADVGVDNQSLSNASVSLDTDMAYERSTSMSTSSDLSLTDDMSYVSTSEGFLGTSPGSGLSIPPPLLSSSSAESLATPSMSSGEPSLSDHPISHEPYNKIPAPGPPVIAEPADLSLPPVPRILTTNISPSSPVVFPSAATSPSTPLSPKRSFPTLSLPNIGSETLGPSSPSSPKTSRLKKPSLHLLFSKRSASPLISPSSPFMSPSSPYLYPRAASESSVSTPISAVTAPQDSTYTLPPVSVQSSPIRLGLGIDEEAGAGYVDHSLSVNKDQGGTTSPGTVPDASITSALVPGETPIADLYHSSNEGARRLRPARSKASVLSTTSNHLGSLECDEDTHDEDWTASVLLAADVDALKIGVEVA